MTIDHDFTEKIQQWLETAHEERDYEQGALYLLKLNGNQIMYRNLMSNPRGKAEFIEYHLRKHYGFRVKELTHAQVTQMQKQVEQIEKKHLSFAEDNPAKEFKQGKRADHDTLPEEIQALYVENLSLLQRMREVHLRLRTLSTADAPCPDSERYPFLKELIELDKKMHANWEQYDHYVAESTEEPVKVEEKPARKTRKKK
ncbi:MAG: hypothetical protein IKY73_05565 [Bacteroidaceae bacterium]|nr:hypothetical protein [Bacteroidaceae bacterium]